MNEPKSTPPESASIRLDVDGEVARLILSRPHSRNALTDQLCSELIAALTELRTSREVRVVVLQGDGPTFCAGGDRVVPTQLAAGDRDDRLHMAEIYSEAFARLDELPQPTIAQIRGAAIGGGALLAITCDLRVCEESSIFRLPEAAMGQYLLAAGTSRLVREIGAPRAKDFILTGRTLDAELAREWGLVTRVAPDARLDAEVDELCATLAALPAHTARLALDSVRAASARGSSGWADNYLAVGGHSG